MGDQFAQQIRNANLGNHRRAAQKPSANDPVVPRTPCGRLKLGRTSVAPPWSGKLRFADCRTRDRVAFEHTSPRSFIMKGQMNPTAQGDSSIPS